MSDIALKQMPFGMLFLDKIKDSERGYKAFPSNWKYNAKTQVSGLVAMGGTLVLSSYQEQDSDTQSDSEDD